MKYVAIIETENELPEEVIEDINGTTFVGDFPSSYRCTVSNINKAPEDVVEREKIDKAIAEIEQAICSYGFCFVSRGMNLALDILKKNIGENK